MLILSKKWRKNRKVEVSCSRMGIIWMISSRMLMMTRIYKMRTTEQLEMMGAMQVITTLRWKSLSKNQTSKLGMVSATIAPRTNRRTCKTCSKGILKSDSMLLVGLTSK